MRRAFVVLATVAALHGLAGSQTVSSTASTPIISGYTVTPFASISRTRDLTFDATGNLYTIDRNSGTIFKITPSGSASVFVDLPDLSGGGYAGPLFDPASGNLFVSEFGDYNGNKIYKIRPNGTASNFAIVPQAPAGLAADQTGHIFVSIFTDAGTIYKIDSTGNAIQYASGLYYPDGLIFGDSGRLYVCNTRNGQLMRVAPGGGAAILFASGLGYPIGATFDSSGNLLVTDFSTGSIVQIDSDGGVKTLGSGFANPVGITFDRDGNLFVADFGANTIYKAVQDSIRDTIIVDTLHLNLSLAKVRGLAEDTVNIQLTLFPSFAIPTLGALDAIINWDGNLAQALAVTKAPATDNFLLESNLSASGEAKIAMVKQDSFLSSPGDVLLNFRFVISNSSPLGTHIPVVISHANLFDLSGNAVSFNTQNGEIFVGNPPGDVNGDGQITIADVILVLQVIVGIHLPTEDEREAADMNGDGTINSADALLILLQVSNTAETKPPTDSFAATSFIVPEFEHNLVDNTFLLRIFGEQLAEVAGGKLQVAFNPAFMKIQRTAVGNSVTQTLADFVTSPNEVRFSFAKESGLSVTGGELVKIQWQVLQVLPKKELTEAVKITGVELYNQNGQSIPVAVRGTAQLGTLPQKYALQQNYPNPFNPATTIRYALPQAAKVELKIYNILGEVVRKLVDEEQAAGFYERMWDGKDQSGRPVSTGIYFYQIRAGDFVQSKKMQLIK